MLNIYTTHWNIKKFCILLIEFIYGGARGSVIGTGLQARSSRVQFRIMSMGFFQWQLPSGRILALSLNKILKEMSTKKISWGKVGQLLGVTNLQLLYVDSLEIGKPETPSDLTTCPGM